MLAFALLCDEAGGEERAVEIGRMPSLCDKASEYLLFG